MKIHEKLNIPEGLHGLSLVQKAVQELKFQIWLRDNMNPPIKPEARKYHESIQDILKFTDEVLEIIDSEILRQQQIIMTVNSIYGTGFNYRDTDNLTVKTEEENNAGL